MDSFYCIIYVRVNRSSDEKIAVGLFANTSMGVKLTYSPEKLALAKKFLPAVLIDDFKNHLAILVKDVKAYNTKPSLLGLDDKFSFDKWTYLSQSNNGLMAISLPVTTREPLTNELFLKLFENHVELNAHKEAKRSNNAMKAKVKETLSKPAFKKIDIAYKVEPTVVPKILSAYQLDFIGKNGALLVGETLNVAASLQALSNKVLAFNRVVQGLQSLSYNYKLKQGKYFLYHDTPESTEAKDLLNRVQKDHDFKFTLQHIDHMPEVASTIEAHNYTTFSSWLIEQGLVAQPQ